MKQIFCLLFFTLQDVGVLGRIEYNTFPLPAASRITPHSPKVISKTCYLKPQQGPCRGNIRMFYYNADKKNCTTFRWGGCQGNGNRFDSHSECMSGCLSTANMPKSRPRYCQLSFDYGFCFGDEKRWYYDRQWKVCKETIYSGCGGNKNNFKSLELCDEICRFGRTFLRTNNTTSSYSGLKKYLIINPANTTSKRGLNQTMPTTKKTANHTKCEEDSQERKKTKKYTHYYTTKHGKYTTGGVYIEGGTSVTFKVG